MCRSVSTALMHCSHLCLLSLKSETSEKSPTTIARSHTLRNQLRCVLHVSTIIIFIHVSISRHVCLGLSQFTSTSSYVISACHILCFSCSASLSLSLMFSLFFSLFSLQSLLFSDKIFQLSSFQTRLLPKFCQSLYRRHLGTLNPKPASALGTRL